ncbi:RNA polymerase sigma factor [Sphingobacterium griseoflavum]|uniref:DNA-binding protein n=1 Tax=Sphingobacterium griseoflavum TaxID=1474952 RepID=A0ABQ3I1U0_9SPHI|nr:sigma-70 family RNA polymerase sigma factor [Sphingobacterium griseoflavum]GHE42038.1 DNA-binding protein [Sphingobacterium griseoflavum]
MDTCSLDDTSICKKEIFAAFFHKQVKALRNFLFYRYGNQDQANDMAQEAFVALWQNCHRVPYNGAQAYLYKVANNKTLKIKAHEKVVLTYQQRKGYNEENHESPQFLLEEKQFKEQLLQAIARLKETQRVAFLMHRIDKMKYAEIAEALGISVKAVEKRIHLAMLALKDQLATFK